MKTLLRIVVLIVVFVVAFSIIEDVSTVVPGTPTNRLSKLMADSRLTATGLAATLDSRQGRAALTGHSRWILLVFLPFASAATALTARALKTPRLVGIVLVAVVVAARIALTSTMTRVFAQLTGVVGRPISGVGATWIDAAIGFALSVTIASLLICHHRPPRHGKAMHPIPDSCA